MVPTEILTLWDRVQVEKRNLWGFADLLFFFAYQSLMPDGCQMQTTSVTTKHVLSLF